MRKQKLRTSRLTHFISSPKYFAAFFLDSYVRKCLVMSCPGPQYLTPSRKLAFKSRGSPADGEVAIMSTGGVYQNILMEAIIARRIVYFQLGYSAALSIEEIIKSLL